MTKDEIILHLIAQCRQYEELIQRMSNHNAVLFTMLQKEAYLKQGRKIQ